MEGLGIGEGNPGEGLLTGLTRPSSPLEGLPGLPRGLGEFAPPSSTLLLHGNSANGVSEIVSGVNNSCASTLPALNSDATSSLAGISNTAAPPLGPALPSSSCLCVLASSLWLIEADFPRLLDHRLRERIFRVSPTCRPWCNDRDVWASTRRRRSKQQLWQVLQGPQPHHQQ